jgi:hypothetical protein
MSDENKKWDAKSTIATFIAICTIVGTLFTVDARYVHAEDAKKEVAATSQRIDETKKTIKDTQILVQQTTTNLRRSLIEDKLFELDAKNAQRKLDPVEFAMKERWKRQLAEMDAQQKNDTNK